MVVCLIVPVQKQQSFVQLPSTMPVLESSKALKTLYLLLTLLQWRGVVMERECPRDCF